jgi:hypothetical protein
MALQYKTRFVNEVLTIKEFQAGGITRNARLIQVESTRASLLHSCELLTLGPRLPLGAAVRACSNYVRHSLLQGIPLREQFLRAPHRALFCLCYPLGLYLKARDARCLGRRNP